MNSEYDDRNAIERLVNFWVRWQACKMTATVLKTAQTEDGLAPYLWSLTVFFESYMHSGSEGTFEDFGPKEPPKLDAIRASITPKG